MSITRRTSATAVANQAADARVVARALGEGVAAPWLFGGALASGLTSPEILGVFAASPSRSGGISDVMAATSELWRGLAPKCYCSGPHRLGGLPCSTFSKTLAQEKVAALPGRCHCHRGSPLPLIPAAQVVSQSLTREKPSQASTAKPKRRRKGFTPRSTSSPAHSARVAEARTTRTACTQPWGCPSHITADASNHTVSSQLGSWASVIRPVVRLRNIQLTNPERFPVSPGVLKIAFLRVDTRPRGSPDRMAPRVDCDSPCTGGRHGRFVPGEVRHDVVFFFRRMRVVGSLGRPVAAFP